MPLPVVCAVVCQMLQYAPSSAGNTPHPIGKALKAAGAGGPASSAAAFTSIAALNQQSNDANGARLQGKVSARLRSILNHRLIYESCKGKVFFGGRAMSVRAQAHTRAAAQRQMHARRADRC